MPVGGFSYSEGLESAVDAGCVSDESTAGDWLEDQLLLVLARADLAVVAGAVSAWREADTTRVAALDAWVLATRETSELRQQTVQMGRSMLEWLKSIDPALAARCPVAPSYPVAFALAASAGGSPPRDVALCFAFGWAENMVQAAVRAVPLGQSAGQRILMRLARAIPEAVDGALGRTDSTRQSLAPMLAILSSRHEAQYSRLFRS